MFRSVRNKLIVAFVVTTTIAVVASSFITFQYVHWREHSISDDMGMSAAKACAAMLEYAYDSTSSLNPNSQEYADLRKSLRDLCRHEQMDYMYAYRCNQETGEITYLVCVADDEESDALVARERGFGTVISRTLSEQELEALAGHETNKALEFNNQFGHMLSWFNRVDGWDGTVLAGADYSVSEQRKRVFQTTAKIVGLVIVAFIVLLFIQLYVLRKNVFKPLRIITGRMKAFSAEKAGEFEPIVINSRDEMGEIADAFTAMAGEIDAYLTDIERMTSERVQASVEMDVARRIQLGMVPETSCIHGPDHDVYALARTAREVGGDFYDCFTIEDDRIAVAIGDVSGKGVAASLFMAMAKTMIHDCLASGESPAATLNAVNDHLCQSNPEGMFVTVFAAVYDPATGIVRFANAGHMPPLLASNNVHALDTDPGVLLGLFEDAGLEDDVVHLASGEALLVYTDGVTEAVDPEDAFFGEERFIAALQADAPYAEARTLIDKAVGAVDAFVESREQFDDLTLLALMRTSGPTELPVDTASFAFVRESIMATSCDNDLKLKACLACEEALVNVVSYSKADHLWFEAAEDENTLHITLIDDGTPFDPTSIVVAEKDFEDLDSGGMGIGLVRQLASDLHYRREDDRNILVIHFEK